MMIDTIIDKKIDSTVICHYFDMLINRVFKILPLREDGEESLPVYIRSLQLELIGFSGFVKSPFGEASLMSLLCTLQYMSDNPECPIPDVKREVFKLISICKKLSLEFSERGE